MAIRFARGASHRTVPLEMVRRVRRSSRPAGQSILHRSAGTFTAPHRRDSAHAGTNLTNTTGLTEGNPRVDTLGGEGTATSTYARPNFGRLFRASLTYGW